MKLYVDYMQGRSIWQLCSLNEIEKYKTEEDFFITWQRYCNSRMCQYAENYGNWPFDFDHESDISIAQKDCIRVYEYLIKKGVNPQNILIYFSGNKGFHLEIDYRSYMDKPTFDLHLIYREFYKHLEKLIKPERKKSTMDSSIYSIRRMWRYPNTRHSKTGLYCIPLAHDELRLSCEKIFILAKGPRDIKQEAYITDPAMKEIFTECQTRYWRSVEDFEKREIFIKEYTGGYPPCIKKIFEEGLPRGARNNTIYLLARFLKKFETEEKIYERLEKLAQKSYSGSEGQEAKNIKSTIASALKRDGYYLACSNLLSWCDKSQCDVFSKKTVSNHLGKVEKAFNTYTYQEAIGLLQTAIKNVNISGFYGQVLNN